MLAGTGNVFYIGTTVPFDKYNQKTGGSGLHLGQLNDSIGSKGAGKRSFELHVYKQHWNISGYFQYDRESDHPATDSRNAALTGISGEIAVT